MLPVNDYFLKDIINCRPLTVSVLSDSKDAVPVSLNEILVGKKWLGQRLEFGYCGNVTPFKTKHRGEMYGIARKLIPALGLVGSNGIDFMVDEKGPCVLEVNPRFQGSIDTVELATGQNLFKAHVDAIEGRIVPLKVRQFAIKGIVFATRKTVVTGNMLRPMIADVPKPGSVFGPDEAIVTITGSGATRGDASTVLRKNLSFVKKNLKALRK
jgi:predicted ATP-grasp superfamily ATP-dependent carboligase